MCFIFDKRLEIRCWFALISAVHRMEGDNWSKACNKTTQTCRQKKEVKTLHFLIRICYLTEIESDNVWLQVTLWKGQKMKEMKVTTNMLAGFLILCKPVIKM